MPQKNADTPDGIICSVCGRDQAPYHYFKYIGRYNRDFFVAGIPARSGVCFECGGPYKCLECGEVKPAADFRLQGRTCKSCKSAPRRVSIRTRTRVSAKKVSVVEDGEKGALWGVLE